MQNNFLGYPTQFHTFKKHLYTGDFHIYISDLDLNYKLQVYRSHCLQNIYIEILIGISALPHPRGNFLLLPNLFLL